MVSRRITWYPGHGTEVRIMKKKVTRRKDGRVIQTVQEFDDLVRPAGYLAIADTIQKTHSAKVFMPGDGRSKSGVRIIRSLEELKEWKASQPMKPSNFKTYSIKKRAK
ncbi:MAG: hypothetical protein KF789_11555 [Bdellovibrionaceae bacterium]|nr:hypothetical protein [Pseudobdellovibrionaceae bacterium]